MLFRVDGFKFLINSNKYIIVVIVSCYPRKLFWIYSEFVTHLTLQVYKNYY